MTAIDLATLNSAPRDQFVEALGGIFEHAPWVAESAFAARPFASVGALYAALGDAVRKAEPARILALIQGHPDLAGKAARAGTLTPDSTAEQAGAGLDRLSDEEFATFHRLNDAYRAKFGFPFIVCVRRHSKDSILAQFERRLTHDTTAELEAAVGEIMRIAALRLDQHVAAPDKLNVHGRLSTHVLDTHAGRPARGLAIELIELAAAGAPRTVARVTTNADGRTDQPLIAGRPVPIGRYELRFHVGAYFASHGVPTSDPPFLDMVPVRFGVAEPEANYHVPLLVTPWSFSTYRGS
ncbi:MAG TPA: 2-oxo-4-hydroxy-4-carboxy-5-ureidoimidazoline decarboxylase [Alphaproteobacteria bacterium]|jgi:2-oxo-4-hydroxy-4-carboxy-5-ureidoimidazoline decarboxylase|nr:2-oxo-4-hydroxy-4-carboxy-5-ureidoimidazoline decarboxylase [Alphaproteobacteria bacterium]